LLGSPGAARTNSFLAPTDLYILNTVVLASVLFLAGLQSRINSVPARMVIVILGSLILAYGLFTIATSPIY
jgi:hypothetical protein